MVSEQFDPSMGARSASVSIQNSLEKIKQEIAKISKRLDLIPDRGGKRTKIQGKIGVDKESDLSLDSYSKLKFGSNFESKSSNFPSFNGNNSGEWILQAEKYFALKCLNNEEQLQISASSFEGVALRWFRWENQRRPFRRWEDMKSVILRQFPSEPKRFQISDPNPVPDSNPISDTKPISDPYPDSNSCPDSDPNPNSDADTKFVPKSDLDLILIPKSDPDSNCNPKSGPNFESGKATGDESLEGENSNDEDDGEKRIEVRPEQILRRAPLLLPSSPPPPPPYPASSLPTLVSQPWPMSFCGSGNQFRDVGDKATLEPNFVSPSSPNSNPVFLWPKAPAILFWPKISPNPVILIWPKPILSTNKILNPTNCFSLSTKVGESMAEGHWKLPPPLLPPLPWPPPLPPPPPWPDQPLPSLPPQRGITRSNKRLDEEFNHIGHMNKQKEFDVLALVSGKRHVEDTCQYFLEKNQQLEAVQGGQVSLNAIVGLSTLKSMKGKGEERQMVVVLISRGGNKKSTGSVIEEKLSENGLEQQVRRFFVLIVGLKVEKDWKLIDSNWALKIEERKVLMRWKSLNSWNEKIAAAVLCESNSTSSMAMGVWQSTTLAKTWRVSGVIKRKRQVRCQWRKGVTKRGWLEDAQVNANIALVEHLELPPEPSPIPAAAATIINGKCSNQNYYLSIHLSHTRAYRNLLKTFYALVEILFHSCVVMVSLAMKFHKPIVRSRELRVKGIKTCISAKYAYVEVSLVASHFNHNIVVGALTSTVAFHLVRFRAQCTTLLPEIWNPLCGIALFEDYGYPWSLGRRTQKGIKIYEQNFSDKHAMDRDMFHFFPP